MADLSKMTTEELLQLQQQFRQQKRDLSGYSTEELMKMRRKPWSDLPGNVAPSAKAVGQNLWHAVTNPEETATNIAGVAQGAVDRVLPEDVTDLLDTVLGGGKRTPEQKATVREASGAYGQQMIDRWGGFERARNTLITDPVGGALEVGSVAVPAIRGGARIVTPLPANAQRVGAANVLRNEGIDLTAGQRTGRQGLQYAESELGGGREALMERQGEQFTNAALRPAGINADRATVQVMDDALNNFAAEFNGLASRNHLVPDARMYNDLTRALNDYQGMVPQSHRAPIIENTIRDVIQTVSRNGPNGGNAIQGAAYDALRSRLETAARGSTDPQLTRALRGIRQALDETMDRSIAQYNPNDIGAWRDVRNRYRNFLVVEDAVTKAGGAGGIISPRSLAQSVKTKHGKRNYGRGRGDYSDLAHAGEELLKSLPQSGTSPRLATRLGPAALGAAIGHGLMSGGEIGPALGALGLGGAAGAWAGPTIAGRLLMSRPVQAYLGNQLLRLPPSTRAGRAVTGGLLATGAANSVSRTPGGRRAP
jgi:hypothetical protein